MFKRRKSEFLSVPELPSGAAPPEPGPEPNGQIQGLEAELAKLWGELTTVRFETLMPEPLRELEIVRLMALQNKLDAEIQRQSEAYLANFSNVSDWRKLMAMRHFLEESIARSTAAIASAVAPTQGPFKSGFSDIVARLGGLHHGRWPISRSSQHWVERVHNADRKASTNTTIWSVEPGIIVTSTSLAMHGRGQQHIGFLVLSILAEAA
jgi:hypothetical protein